MCDVEYTVDFMLLPSLTGLTSQVSWELKKLVRVMMQDSRSGTLASVF